MLTTEMLWISVAVLLMPVTHARAGNCMEQQSMPGFMLPQGDVIVEYGTPLEIWCVLDPEHNATLGYNASHIRFTHDRGTVPAEYVQVVNATTARLYMEHAAPLMNSNFFCRLKTRAERPVMVCMNHVVIGYAPSKLKVENFQCISQHLRNINCSWNIVPENTVRTHYNISYSVGPEETRYLNRFICPDRKSPDFGYCSWNDKTKPNYRDKNEIYYFTITAENVLGQKIFDEIEFNQWAHAILEKPDYLNGSDITTNGVVLHWRIDSHLKPLSLKYRLQYRSEASECDPEGLWKVVDTSDFGWRTTSYEMTNLPYANFLYDVRLSIAPSSAEGDDIWSKPATYTFRTKPKPPDSPPQLAPGSFQVAGRESSRDVFIFWQRLSRCSENGEEFQYKVVAKALDGSQADVNANVSKSSFAKFSNLSLNAYEISVVASNKEGTSQSAVIVVPEKKQMPPAPSQISEYILDKDAVLLRWDNQYSGEWADQIESFTVFWCLNEQETSSHCSGSLNYEVVDKTVSSKKIATNSGKVYAFGVAANTQTSSSGISWVSCVIRPGNTFGKVRPSVLRAGNTFVEMSFSVECVDTLHLAHYDVYYCPINTPEMPECREEEKAVTVEASSKQVNVTGLTPYTTYRLWVVPVDRQGRAASDRSPPVNTTTLEARPTPPRSVVVSEVTGDAACVRWAPPAAPNGYLRHYELSLGGGGDALRVAPGRTEACLQGLDGYSDYDVVVSACTVSCTAAAPVRVRTRVGRPAAPDRPTPRLLDGATMGLRWEAPQPPGGPAPTYQALVEAADGHNFTTDLHAAAPGDLSDTISFQGCEADPHATFRVYVRAVNIDENNLTIFGNWSSPAEVDCSLGIGGVSTTRVVLWCAGTLAVLLAGAALVHGARRLARWWRVARGVQVKLPPGLAPAPVTEPLDKAERASERLVRTPWILYGARGAPAPDSPTHEETTLLRAARHGGGSSGGGSDGALSSLASATTTAASDSDADHEHDHEQEREQGSKPRAARQWSTFSDGSVSRSTPNLWEAEHAPGYCRAGLPAAGGYVAVASAGAPYVRRGSLDGWPPPTGYTQIGAVDNNELVCASELKARPEAAPAPGGHVARPEAAKDELLRRLQDHWLLTQQAAAASKAAPGLVARTHQPQGAAAAWPTIRCEVPPPPPVAAPAPSARGYVTVDCLPPPSTPAGYVVCSAAPAAPSRPPDGYVAASPPPDGYVAASPPPPPHNPKPAAGTPYVAMGDVTSTPVHRPAVPRGYVTLQQLGQT